jgi:murein DD-endopeptidase MepM/ murein hydrolase activator NlpD
MGLKHHTIILVPHERARFRKWRVSNRQVAIGLTSFTLLFAICCFTTWFYFSTTVDRAEIDRMRVENERLREVNASFETSLGAIRQQLSQYEERTRQLAIVAGLEGISGSGETGLGGGELALDGISARTDFLSGRLDTVESALVERRDQLSATPSIIPVRGILTSGFGVRRDPIRGHLANHLAVDIAASPGKAVQSTADGLITEAGRVAGGLGIAVYVSHGYGLVTRYGHLQRVAVKAGQRVRRGDIVGYVGNTGRSTGYHLHYEVIADGKPVDPLAYILDLGSGGDEDEARVATR